jgi:hypothetical protein
MHSKKFIGRITNQNRSTSLNSPKGTYPVRYLKNITSAHSLTGLDFNKEFEEVQSS